MHKNAQFFLKEYQGTTGGRAASSDDCAWHKRQAVRFEITKNCTNLKSFTLRDVESMVYSRYSDWKGAATISIPTLGNTHSGESRPLTGLRRFV